MPKLFRLAACLLATVFLSLAPLVALNPRPKVAQSVYALSWNGSNHCTVSSINAQHGFWLTAAHCVDSLQVFMIDDHAAFVVRMDRPTDLAVLVTPDWYVPAIKLAKHGPKYGDDVSIWGHPLGWQSLMLFKGYVSNPSFNEPGAIEGLPQALYGMIAAPGSSGSAVLDKHNELVGVLQWAVHDRSFAFVSGGIDFDHFRAFVVSFTR